MAKILYALTPPMPDHPMIRENSLSIKPLLSYSTHSVLQVDGEGLSIVLTILDWIRLPSSVSDSKPYCAVAYTCPWVELMSLTMTCWKAPFEPATPTVIATGP